MTKPKTTTGRFSIQKMFKIILQEMVDIRRELKEDIANLDRKLSTRMDSLEQKLTSDLQVLRLEVHQNQVTFIKNHEQLEKRVGVLEIA